MLLAALALVLAACGGGDDDVASTEAEATTTTVAESGDTSATEGASDTTDAVEVDTNNGDDIADDGERVAVFYTGTLDDGTEFDSNIGAEEAFTFTLGVGQVIPGFDDAVRGLKVGESVIVTIPVDEAYGESDPEFIVDFPIDEVPEEFREEGLQVQLANGQPAVILEVTDEIVKVDTNHPLAGEALTFEIQLDSIL